ncbi:MAG: diguanylate cyclase, partial [Acidobacteria bacterium]|nr:diguanylate cyclase [Acidobacteriota bacterium]
MTESTLAAGAWHRRLDTRVAVALGLLVAAALGAMLLVTIGVASAQSRARAGVELDVARQAFYALLDGRVAAAVSTAQVITKLPVFRAYITETRLVSDRASMDAMAEEHRAQMQAAFAIVTSADGTWLGQSGWTDGASAGTLRLRQAQAAALDGRTADVLVLDGGRLFLVVAVPARFGDEIVGAFLAGYALTDAIAGELARLARCEVALVAGGQVVATSVSGGRRAEVSARLAEAVAAPGVTAELLEVGGRRYVAGVYPLRPGAPGGAAGQLLVLSDWAPTQAFIDALRQRFALGGAAALALSLLVGAVVSRHLSRPLRDIAAAAAQVSAGNFALDLPVRGTVEAATVARAFNDMSVSLRTAHARLTHDAIHDHLTRLPNRALFTERLERALARRVRHPDYQFAVLFVDLDRFKHVNDSLGHTAGDRLLVLFAERLNAVVRRSDVVVRMAGDPEAPEPTLARIGGDEFAVLLDDIREPIDAVRVAKRIQRTAPLPLSLDGQDVFTSASIGVAVASAAHRSGEDVIRDADLAMYRAKKAGGDGYAVFDTALHEMAVQRLRLETDLRRAVERHEFRVWYQPIVTLADARVAGVEALVRWQHPELGLVAPALFLEVAEEIGLIAQIDEWVLREACRQGAEWRRGDAATCPATISVNVSAKAFAQDTLVARVLAALHTTGYPASGLRVEVTESVAIGDPARARAVLSELRDLGVRVSLDDFGTG